MVGLSSWRKSVQDMDTRADWVLVSCHYDLCPEALEQKVILALKGTEKAMFKIDLHEKWFDQAQPEFALISKKIQEPSAVGNSQKVQLEKKLKHMKNALHIEYPLVSVSCMLAVWKELEEGGKLQCLLGRDIAILEVGYQN